MKKVSVVTPCFNEEDSIEKCILTVRQVFETELPHYELEHIFCDNSSTDQTVSMIKQAALSDKRIKLIVNSRNFGILKNTYHGVMQTSGDAVLLFLPVDLQDPPELIPTFIREWEKGYEIVYGIRSEREEPWLIKTIRKIYYRLLSRLTYVDYPPDTGDFQLVDRVVINAMKKIDDAQPFMRLMTFDCGFSSIGIRYVWRARQSGISRNYFRHMIAQGLNGIISFSNAPLRLALFAGLFLFLASFLYAICLGVLSLVGNSGSLQDGILAKNIPLFFLGGIQLFCIGILGEYIFAIFNQVRHKPLVIERERINFDNDL